VSGPGLALLLLAWQASAEPRAAGPDLYTPDRCAADLLVDSTLSRDTDLGGFAPTLIELGLPTLLLVNAAQIEGFEAELEALAATGIEIGLWSPAPSVLLPVEQRSLAASWTRIRQERRAIKRAVGRAPRAAGTGRLDPSMEAALDVLGFGLVLPAPDGLMEPPRRAVDPQGLEGSAVVLWPVQPQLDSDDGPWDLLDRTARALEAGAQPVIRLSIPSALLGSQADLLQAWRRDVLEPCGASILGREAAEDSLRAWLRARAWASGGRRIFTPPAPPPGSPPSGPSLPRAALVAVAESLACDESRGTLPRRPAGVDDLSLAWLALSMQLAGTEPPLQLYAVRAPQSSPRSTLPPEGLVIDPEALRSIAADLVPGPGQQIPSFVRVGGQALTAAELLCAMAATVVGRDPVLVHPTYSPDPYAPGLGWALPPEAP
jgi:hypothetical protein